MEKKTFYITTPIYYASGNLHIGHTYTTVVCDAIAKYKKMKGYDVYYLTGTDEHGQKIQEKAKEKGVTPQEFVDDLVVGIKDLWKKLKVDYDKFIRTTDEYHVKNVQKIFTKMLENGDIYKSSYEGWYCTPCESFWTESQLGEGHVCPDCGRPVHLEKEEAYFFKMSKYADRLMKYYEEHPGFIEPDARQNEMVNNFLKPGLNDLCVSRTSFDWGIPVNEDPKHVVYVWLDALLNYVTALGYNTDNPELFEKYWVNGDEKVHVLGKEITRFHLLYWPVFLMALDLPLPDKFVVHGWIVMKDGKMSKSKGNVVYPEPLKEMYGMDLLRYYLLREIPFCEDGNFTPEQFIERCNADLANNYGNLTHRSLSMIKKYFNGTIPAYNGCVTEFDAPLEAAVNLAKDMFFEKMDKFDVTNAIASIFEAIDKANKYVDEAKPWALAKDESKKAELESVMCHLANTIYTVSVLLSPFLTEGSKKILDMLNCPEHLRNYDAIKLPFGQLQNVNIAETLTPAYARLDAAVEIERMKENIYTRK